MNIIYKELETISKPTTQGTRSTIKSQSPTQTKTQPPTQTKPQNAQTPVYANSSEIAAAMDKDVNYANV